MPCKPLQLNMPSGPSGPAIPGFGVPFALKTPDLKKELAPFPENLLELLEKLELLMPPGKLKPQLSRNSGKDPFDAIMKLLDQFMPFLMLYKFFLPILNLIICIIEVLCAIPNPFKLAKALIKLFRQCIPQFLNLFPIFALIIMIISLLLLLLALIEYIVQQVTKLVLLIIKQIKMLGKAFEMADEKAILAIAKKIGAILCYFQQLMVLMSIFTSILQTIKEMLGLIFAIPPCDDDCCTPDVCPTIAKNPYTRFTGELRYLNQVIETTDLGLITIETIRRAESWQLYDQDQEKLQAFMNIINAADVPIVPGEPKPIFFPTDATYSKDTSPQQAPYTVDLRLFYNPANWGRTGKARFVRINKCIVLSTPKTYFLNYVNLPTAVNTGVLTLAGGIVYEDDGATVIPGFDGGLNTFLHKPEVKSSSPVLLPTDGYLYNNIEYTFTPNQPILLGKNLITAGCLVDLAKNKDFVNTLIAGDIGLKLALVNAIPLPDTNAAQECILNAADELSVNFSEENVANFQATVLTCLDNLKLETIRALKDLIGAGFDPCKSKFTISPRNQFTTKPIIVSVTLNDTNGLNLASNIPSDLAADLAQNIKAYVNVGVVSPFVYDGTANFIGEWTSDEPGQSTIMISFENQIFCKNNIPENLDEDPSRELQELEAQFVYVPSGTPGSEGDSSEGVVPRRDGGTEALADNNNSDPTKGEVV